MFRTFLLIKHDDQGQITELVCTFDTVELAQEFVASGLGQGATWLQTPGNVWISYGARERWSIRDMPHNGVAAMDWVDPR